METDIFKYFKIILDDLFVLKGYHELKVYSDPFFPSEGKKDNLIIFIKCKTDLEGVNKLIPYIRQNNIKIIKDLLLILRKDDINYDYIYEDIKFKALEVKIIFIQFISYFNLNRFPVELIKIISNYLSTTDYLNFLDILNLYNYEDYIEYLSKEMIIYGKLHKITVFDNKPVIININEQIKSVKNEFKL